MTNNNLKDLEQYTEHAFREPWRSRIADLITRVRDFEHAARKLGHARPGSQQFDDAACEIVGMLEDR